MQSLTLYILIDPHSFIEICFHFHTKEGIFVYVLSKKPNYISMIPFIKAIKGGEYSHWHCKYCVLMVMGGRRIV